MAERIGQILLEMGVLDARQVHEIAEHQKTNPQKFGQVAVAWGWAKPEQVWEAWAKQMVDESKWINLDEFGLDTKAIARVPAGVAQHYGVVPVRAWGDNLVLAIAKDTTRQARTELRRILGGNLYFCLAEKRQIQAYLAKLHALQPC